MGKSSGILSLNVFIVEWSDTEKIYRCVFVVIANKSLGFHRLEDFLVPELQATEEEKSKLDSGLTNGDEPMDQDLSVLPTKCISNVESLEIRSVKSESKNAKAAHMLCG